MNRLISKLLIVTVLFGAIACQEVNGPEQIIEANMLDRIDSEDEFITTEGQTVLGDVIDIPYSIENLLKAYENLPVQTKSQIDPNYIKPTHYYIRFYPKSIEELDVLRNLKPYVFLSEIPLDREIVVGGTSYHDPSIPQSLPTFQYTVVPVDRWRELEQTVPVEAEILIKAYMPDYNEAYTTKSEEVYGIPASSYEALLKKAYEMTGNQFVPETKAAWTPSGKITSYDSAFGDFVPIPNVRVRVSHLLKVKEALTSVQGQFTVDGTFNSSVNYKIVWESDQWDIRDGDIGQATYDGPNLSTSWYCKLNSPHQKNLRYAAIQRAAYIYYNNTLGFLQPITTLKLKYCLHDSYNSSNGKPSAYDTGTHKIEFWIKDSTSMYLPVYEVFYHAIHETAHFTHFTWTGDYYNNHPGYIKESWAFFVSRIMTKDEYQNLLSDYQCPTLQYWPYISDLDAIHYTPVFLDLYDNYNQSFYGFSIFDGITGYTINQLNNMVLYTTSWSDLESKANTYRPANYTASDINYLIQQFASKF